MDLKQTIGKRVRDARRRAGLTQEQLAERIERAVETVSNLERGATVPKLDTLESVSRALGVPIREFFDESEEGAPRRAELRLTLNGMVGQLSTDDLEIAVQLVQVLVKARSKKGEITLPEKLPPGWEL